MKKTFTGRTRLFICLSSAIILVALLMQLFGAGLNLGVDFTGGSLLRYAVGEDFALSDVELILKNAGYEGSQVTKLAPSELVELAPIEESEPHVHEDGEEHDHEHDHEHEEEVATAQSYLLDMDKSGIEKDGMTDLQIRLNLLDESAGLNDALLGAAKSVLEGAEGVSFREVTAAMILDEGFDASYAGGYIAEILPGAAFDAEAVQAAVESALEEGFNAQRVSVSGDEQKMLIAVKLDDEAARVRAELEKEMSAKYEGFRFISIGHVSAIAGKDLLSNAVYALLIAFACMLIYIAIRFDPFSGLAALVALLHDVLVMCSFMVFFRSLFQVNSSFIAAVLTIVGYSINNTIIIFDRIRENVKRSGKATADYAGIVEKSVSSTLSRTINTALTTLVMLVLLYVFGVESIREFAFPLIVGMLAGTYSSVMLSGQIWAMWMKRRAARKLSKKA